MSEEKVKLQWVKGDKAGTVEIVEGTDGQWTIFEGGGRIATNLISEFMLDTSISGVIDSSDLNLEPQNQPIPVNEKEVKPAQKSPIRSLLDSSKNLAYSNLEFNIAVQIPTASLYSVLLDSFGDDSIDEIHSFVIDQVDQEVFKKALVEAIENLFKA
tara:strand:- start:1756 stop:2226 length:471 start_codon:yes stop_codon:yes gene_type:complete